MTLRFIKTSPFKYLKHVNVKGASLFTDSASPAQTFREKHLTVSTVLVEPYVMKKSFRNLTNGKIEHQYEGIYEGVFATELSSCCTFTVSINNGCRFIHL